MSKLYRGRKTNGDWEKGFAFSLPSDSKTQRLNPNKAYILSHLSSVSWSEGSGYTLGNFVEVDKETVGECTRIPDQMGRMIYEGDILEGVLDDSVLVRCLVCIGEYEQDGSGNEYAPTKCYGIFVKVLPIKDTVWENADMADYPDWKRQRNILEVASYCKIVGNIHDNPELFEQQEVANNA